MSDASVAQALRAPSRLVVIRAPAGCGKTFQGAQYARDIATTIGNRRVLILAHTHAAIDVFASRTQDVQRHVEIRTIDSLVAEIAGIYHSSLGLPQDISSWLRTEKDAHCQLAAKVSKLLTAAPILGRSLAQRYPILICDEHQDASRDQHSIPMACHSAGACVRLFGDPMQMIFVGKEGNGNLWNEVTSSADTIHELDTPHRWSDGSKDLGQWILKARQSLEAGQPIDLRGDLPYGVSVCVAENLSKAHGHYQLRAQDRKPIDDVVRSSECILVLAAHNKTVDAIRAFFRRTLPIWEGHVREHLAVLTEAVQTHKNNPDAIAASAVSFLENVATGFSPSAFGRTLLEEVRTSCVSKRRGKPLLLQDLAKLIIDQPNHKGVATMLLRLNELRRTHPLFKSVHLDYAKEFFDAVQLGNYEEAGAGLTEMTRRRSYIRPRLPLKAISTIHKAKGLEIDNVIIMPCDAHHFPDSLASRRRLYVAMSRARKSLTLVVSTESPTPLFVL